MRDFHEMSADEIKGYKGPVYRARIEARRGNGPVVAHDFESTTPDGLDDKIKGLRAAGWAIQTIRKGPHTRSLQWLTRATGKRRGGRGRNGRPPGARRG